MNDFQEFLVWETSTRDTIDFKKTYVDMVDDVLAGLMLSEIIYWHLPTKKGSENKLRIEKDSRLWIAVRRYDWWDRIRLSPRQSDRAITILKELGLLETNVFKFYGEPTVHVCLNKNKFLELWNNAVNHETVNPFSPIRENEITESGKTKSRNQVKPLTETTAEITTVNKPRLSKADVPLSLENQLFVDTPVIVPFVSALIKAAITDNFKLNVAWEQRRGKGRGEFIPADFLDYCRDQAVTPQEIKAMAGLWKTEKEFNWRYPQSLKMVWEQMPRMLELIRHQEPEEHENESEYQIV